MSVSVFSGPTKEAVQLWSSACIPMDSLLRVQFKTDHGIPNSPELND